MGWCSGTIIFDEVCKALLDDKPIDKHHVIETVALALWNSDWDCEMDSDYFEHPVVREVLSKHHPDLYSGD